MQADCRLQCNARIYMKIMTLTAVLTTSKLHNQCSLIKFICLLLKPPYIYTAATRLRLSFKFNDFAKLKMNSIIVWWICWRSDLENFNLFLTVVNWLSSRLCMQVKMGFSCLIISFQHWELNILQTSLCLTWRWCINHQYTLALQPAPHPLQEKTINTIQKYFSLWIANISLWLQSISAEVHIYHLNDNC